MIHYPYLKNGATIGVTAPSSGVKQELHHLVERACNQMKSQGFTVVCGDTVWTQEKAKSSPAVQRADEFNQMMRSEIIDLIIPPWGGELLLEMLEHVDFDQMPNKWVLGYSDTSSLLLAITLKTGIATAHGVNLIDLRGEEIDATTALWKTVLSTAPGKTIIQHSSELYQEEWQHDKSLPSVYHLTEPTFWKTVGDDAVTIKGRLLGGCIDIIRHLIGTPYGNVNRFREDVIHGEPVIWYFENCELTTVDLRRSLVQMKAAGWFEGCTGILFGRSDANQTIQDYTIDDVYQELSAELNIPVVYDIDCGHVPPQMTLVNGAYAEVEVQNGKGTITQLFI